MKDWVKCVPARLRKVQSHCRLILITSLDAQRMADVGVECHPKEELNAVIREVLAGYHDPNVLYMPQAGLTLPYVEN